MGKDSLVIVRLIGGLGNQLFQIQQGLNFIETHGGQLAFDNSFLKNSKKSHEIIAMPELIKTYPKVELSGNILKLRRVIERGFYKVGITVPKLFKPIFLFEKSINDTAQNKKIIIDGFWQDKKYINQAFLTIVRTLIKKRSSETPSCVLNDEHAVCVHIRRGDYLTNKRLFIHQQIVLSNEYYQRAMSMHLERDPHCVFHIYTDDEKWAKNDFYANEKNVLIVPSSKMAPADLLSLMSSYQHFIIANSTLSWWAAVLSCQDKKMVVMPALWGKNTSSNPYRLDTWILA